jgi:Flp pilus assembly CpaF family ATPase
MNARYSQAPPPTGRPLPPAPVSPDRSEMQAPQPTPGTVELGEIAKIREAVAAQLTEARRTEGADVSVKSVDDASEVAQAEAIIWQHLDQHSQWRASEGHVPLTIEEEEAVFRRVKADLFGLGGFEEYLFDPTVENIFVNGCDRAFVNRSGAHEPEPIPPVADSDQSLIELVNRWASRLGRTERRFDVSNPRLDLRLPGGFRLHAIMEVTRRPTITIRCPYYRRVDLNDIRNLGTLDQHMVEFLTAAVRARFNIIVAGGTGTGKTTLLRAMLHEVPAHERIITIEDTAELGLAEFEDDHPNVVEMETRQANMEGVGELTMLELTRECLRMSPDRVVLGEVRGAEALYMLKAMSQGNDGSMCTVHADSAVGVADRIRGYCAEGANGLPMEVIDGFYRNAVDLVIHLRVLPSRVRVVSSIIEIEKSQTSAIPHNELFVPMAGGLGVPHTRPSEPMMERLRLAGYGGPLW